MWAARRLSEATGERLVDMATAAECDYSLRMGERLGFCFPVHGWQPPRLVLRFIRRLHIRGLASVPYCYAVCTCGDNIGLTMKILRRCLHRQHIQLHSTFSLVMPETYVALPFMLTDPLPREREKLRQADIQLRQIEEDVKMCRMGLDRTVRGPLPWLLSYGIGEAFNRWMITDRPFKVDAGCCVHCGLCAKVCPTGDLVCQRGQLPQWLGDGRCAACMSCYHHCPHHAISYGPLTRRRGQYYYGKNKI